MSPQQSIAHYRITAKLGEGGMGAVYRANDTKLNREVAIKVIPDSFAADPDRMARFEREAQVLASLNHPNIAAIYGVEERALVMELVEGETLHGPLPVEQALPIIQQLIDALEYAQDKGIVHRDLKPANIKITPEGRVKVLDFGLAKALSNDAPTRDPASSPTITMRATQAGVIMGTAAYMSPEQARGHNVDRRADIWAFGVVVYEMLTGRMLFRGETVSDTLAAVLTREPDFSAVPARFERLLRLCLVRDARQRLSHISGARLLLEEPEAPRARTRSLPWMIAAAAVILAATLGVLLYRATRPPPPRPLLRLTIDLGPDTPLARVRRVGMLALSPDGTRLAVAFRGADGKVRLGTRMLDQTQTTPLAGAENAESPFFSPDGQWLGFFADGKLKKISVNGGAAVALCDAPFGRGGSWGDDGNIILALNATGALSRLSSSGGTPVPVTRINPGEMTHRWPQSLPGSQAVLFTALARPGDFDEANIDVVSLKTGERKTVVRGCFYARYVATSSGAGYLVYMRQHTLFAAPFDPRRLAVTGASAPILDDVGGRSVGIGDFAFAETGTFVYLVGRATQPQPYPILWLDSSGKTQPLHAAPGSYAGPRFSPDGKRLAFSASSGPASDIWVQDLARETASRLTFLSGLNDSPVWTPDGKDIVFSSGNRPSPGIYWIRSDGSGDPQRLTDGKLATEPNSFSPDGKRLAFYARRSSGNSDIFTAAIEGDRDHRRLGKPELFLGTPFDEGLPAFSPDQRWLAYASNESGAMEVYVRPFPGPGGRWQISSGGGTHPVWSRSGRELFFQSSDGRIMVAGYTASGGAFAAGAPRVWSQTRARWYDLAPDGKRVAIFPLDNAYDDKPLTQVTVLLNFFDELQRRVPAGGG